MTNDRWRLLLVGARTLLGRLDDNAFCLNPVYQIEKRPTPVQGVDPNTGKHVQGMQMRWTIMAVAELDGITSVEVPTGAILIPVSTMLDSEQKLLGALVEAFEKNKLENARKTKVDAEAAVLARGGSFGGGARSDS